MSAQTELIDGTSRDVGLSQWFTPPELAQRVVEWANLSNMYDVPGSRPMRVLEPSAGNGALVRPLVAAGADVTALEFDERYESELLALTLNACCPLDFLKAQPVRGERAYDLCVQNPPYENGMDVAFILHALKFAPRVVGIFRSALLHGATRKRELWSQVRPTRIAFLADRPKFGEGNGARSDFIVAELVVRADTSRFGKGYAINATMEWW